jgi:hypothetical protein
MTPLELDQAREAVWRALGDRPMRRRLLGRKRCDAIVRVALSQIAAMEGELRAAGPDGIPAPGGIRRRIEERVRAVYAENCGMAFTTLVLVWAISAIVQALVIRWLNSRSET